MSDTTEQEYSIMEREQDKKQNLETYFRAKFPQRKELFLVEMDQLTAGVSRENYSIMLSWQEFQAPVSESLFLQVASGGFHDPERYDFTRQYEALKRVYGAGIPVPKVHWVEMDSKIMGYPFAVMEKVEGELLAQAYKEQPQHQPQLVKDYVEILAKIHGLDWRALGLSFLEMPETQDQRLEMMTEAWQSLTGNTQDNPQPIIAELTTWLKRNIQPPNYTTLCHSDYHLRNILACDGRIVALLDWEAVRIGDPVSDLGWACVFLTTVYSDFCTESDFIRNYERAAGVKVDQERLLFWKVWAALGLISVGLAAIQIGLESEPPDIRQLGIWNLLVPRLQDTAAQLLGF